MMRAWKRLPVRAWLVVLMSGVAAAARAGDDAAARPSPAGDTLVTTVRLQVPLSRFFLWSADDGVATIVGGSLNGRFAGLFELEGGVDKVTNICDNGSLFTGRGGVAPPLRRAATRGTSWEVRLPLLAGYHHTQFPSEGCEYSPATTIHAVSANAGLDATYWTAWRWGLNMRLLGGVGRAWKETEDLSHNVTSRVDRLWDLSLAVGLSF